MRPQFICFLFSFIFPLTSAQQPLRFNSNHEFKILQLTDLHYDFSSDKKLKTLETMGEVIVKEHPDLIVITGDIVTAEPAKEAWAEISEMLVSSKTPWTVTFGNHDEEHNMSKEDIYQMLRKMPYFIGEKGTVSGVMNFELPILSHDGTTVSAVLYFLDSHDYTMNPRLGKYDWIKADQIAWYKTRSDYYTLQNSGSKIPSLMFFHIPLLEFNHVADDKATIGDKLEGVASPEINSGLFSAVLEQKDVMGIFTGHDHDNNYIGNYRGVALGFGNVTGADAYGALDRGGRSIVLKEGRFQFESYVVTPTKKEYIFNYPSGLSTIKKDTPVLKSIKVKKPLNNGLMMEYFEGEIASVKEISKLTAKERRPVQKVDLSPAQSEDHFAMRYKAYFYAPTTNFYKFYIYSDDGATLAIHDRVIVDNDGGHSAQRKEGIVALEKGYHPIEILYFEDYMGQSLDVGVASIEMPEGPLSSNQLFYK